MNDTSNNQISVIMKPEELHINLNNQNIEEMNEANNISNFSSKPMNDVNMVDAYEPIEEIEQMMEELKIFEDNNMNVDTDPLLENIFNNKDRQSSIKVNAEHKSQDSDWVDLIINPNEEDSDDKENIETNILLKSSIKRLTAAKLAQEQEDIIKNSNWNNHKWKEINSVLFTVPSISTSLISWFQSSSFPVCPSSSAPSACFISSIEIFPLLSLSNTLNAALRFSSFKYIFCSMVVAVLKLSTSLLADSKWLVGS